MRNRKRGIVMGTEAIISRSIKSRIFAIAISFVLVFTCVFIISSEPAYAAGKTDKLTMYKGQTYLASVTFGQKAKFTSSKKGVVKLSNKKKKSVVLNAKKAGKSTIRAAVKGWKVTPLLVTVKNSYPLGANKRPAVLKSGDGYQTLKTVNGKKSLKVKATIYRDVAAYEFLDENDGPMGVYNELNYNKYKDGFTFYLVRYDFQILKGYSSSSSAKLEDLSNVYCFNDKNGVRLKCDKAQYIFNELPKKNSGFTNGTSEETLYAGFWLPNTIDEVYMENVGARSEFQKGIMRSGSKIANNFRDKNGKTYLLSGCVKLML